MDHLIPANPFTHQGMIRDVNQFVGRSMELDQIINLLKMVQGVSLVGERRIGKSSLLYNIFLTGQAKFDKRTKIAYTDFPNVKDEASFYECLCKQLGKPGDKFSDLEDLVHNRKVVFCFDEFERVMRSPKFERAFFDTLRSLAQSDNFTLLIATEHPLSELSLNEHIATSPFFNIFRQIRLGLFTPQEAQGFIRKRFTDANVTITEGEIERALRLAGRYPFFLQQACFRLFEMKVGRAAEWERSFKRHAKPHLQYLWSRLKSSERATLSRAIDVSLGSPNELVIEDLEQRGLLVCDDKTRYGWGGFSEVFEEVV